jgi:predicted nucleotide-binding protein
VADYPAELAKQVNEIDREIGHLWVDGRYAEAESFFKREYDLIRFFEDRLPENKRFHKGSPLYNWGLSILLQKKPERAEEGFRKILLAYIEDLLDFESFEKADLAPAHTVLANNPFYEPSLLVAVSRLVREIQKRGEIPRDPAVVIDKRVSDGTHESATKFVANSRKVVFIIHGRNLSAVAAMREFLLSIKLIPKTLDDVFAQMDQATPQVEDALRRAFSLAHAVIVLLTPDDVGYLRKYFRDKNDLPADIHPTGQPRLNVIYEAGWAMGGPFRDRTILVEMGSIRSFSDIGGLITMRLNDKPEKRRLLIDHLNAAQCDTDPSSGAWRTAGKFDSSIKDLGFRERVSNLL